MASTATTTTPSPAAATVVSKSFAKDLQRDIPAERLNVLPEFMRQGNCCQYCALRLVGCKNMGLYQQPPDVLLATINEFLGEGEEPIAIDWHSRICAGCGNIIPRCHDADFRAEYFERFKSCGYNFTTYIMTIHYPVSYLIRQHSLWLLGKRLSPEGFAEATPEDVAADVKEGVKWILGPLLDRTLGTKFHYAAPFKIEFAISAPECDKEARFFLSHFVIKDKAGRQRHNNNRNSNNNSNNANDDVISPVTVAKLLRGMTSEVFSKYYPTPPPFLSAAATYAWSYYHESVFVAGRYNKYCQELSQTPWILDDGSRMHESSIQELICEPLQRHFSAREYRFSASGREDIDVRMLGNGRPFAVELIDPKSPIHSEEEFAGMQKEINESTQLVQVAHLQGVTAKDTTMLKEAETAKIKHYRALVWTSKCFTEADKATLEGVKDLKLKQKTPIRVLHRRSLATRDKVIHSIGVEQLSPHFVVLSLKTSAGTYIKEFCHGDLGRTMPNVGSLLGCEADILQLDVTGVETEFPKPIRPVPILPHTFSLPESFVIADREQREEKEEEVKEGEDNSIVPPPEKVQKIDN